MGGWARARQGENFGGRVALAITNRAEEIADANADMVVDNPSKGALAVGAVVLESFETLLPQFDRDERRTILYLQHVMGGGAEAPLRIRIPDPQRARQSLDKIDKACRAEEPFYGSAWDIHYERPEPGLFEMKVKRCFWREFFDRHDARLVTTVMCAFDTTWMRAINPSVSGLRAERTSLLSLGDDECRFAVLETDDPLAGYKDKLEQRFVPEQESA
jgi:L-2-amino-thiazoline-4-carboxylic acid hydrolase